MSFEPEPSENDGSGPEAPAAGLLGGDLPCARCGYNLRGLSIRIVCPECGLPVRVTLLSRLDPLAGELQPVIAPAATGAGLLVWAWAALGAALMCWVQRARGAGAPLGTEPWLTWGAAVFTGVSGVGALALVRPHARAHPLRSAAAVVLYGPLVATLAQIHARLDVANPSPYAGPGASSDARLALHAASMATVGLIAILFRPTIRLLAARHRLMRSGHVDRQPMLALAIAAMIAMAGDGLRWWSAAALGSAADLLEQVGSGIVLVGSVLLTVGLAGLSVDVVRLRRLLIAPPLAPSQILDPGGEAASA